MSRKVKVSDIRQGVTLYTVYAFPHKDGNAWVEAAPLIGRPFVNKNTNSMFAPYNMLFDDGHSANATFSLKDKGIMPNRYNFHKTFHTRKAAQRYADRMKRGCLSAVERQRACALGLRDLEISHLYSGF